MSINIFDIYCPYHTSEEKPQPKYAVGSAFPVLYSVSVVPPKATMTFVWVQRHHRRGRAPLTVWMLRICVMAGTILAVKFQ